MLQPNSKEFLRKARWGLFILTMINILNYVDRYVVSALVESLKKSELALTDTQAGLLMTSFLIVYMFTSPIFGALGDKKNRLRLMAFGVAIWSVATCLGGFATSFIFLFSARALLGVGEAAYGTISPALLSDYYPPASRGKIFSIFYCAIPIGAALGYVIGGYMDTHYGWRSAFYVAGIPGLVLAVLVLGLMDPPRGIFDEPSKITYKHQSLIATLKSSTDLFKNSWYSIIVLGYAAYTFALGALAFWIPAFLEREKGMTRQTASYDFGLVVIATGFVGTFVGGWLDAYLAKKYKNANLWLSGVATLLAVPFVFLCLVTKDITLFWVCIVIAEILVFSSTGPINAAIIEHVPVSQRATAIALSILGCHILGDVPSPPLIGWISDHSNLQQGMMLIPVAFFIAGVLWLVKLWRPSQISA